MKIAYIKLYSVWQGRRILIATTPTAERAREYMAQMPNIEAQAVFVRTGGK